jgi:16S rRNA (guanine527-N7)-methyltransferase
MLPDAAVLARIEGLAREMGLAVDAAQVDALAGFLALLQRWNATYNLTAVRDPEQMLAQHLADCLAVVAPLQRQLGDAGRLLDVGSGGGLPGAVLAIMRPRLDVTCVDAVGKKAAFVRQVAAELALPNLRAEHARVQTLKLPPFDVIASRAFASLADFVAATAGKLAPTGVWMAMKGKRPDVELAALPANVDVFHVEPVRVPGLDAERCLIWMRPQQVRAHN